MSDPARTADLDRPLSGPPRGQVVLRLGIGIAISAVSLIVVLRGVDLDQVAQALGQTRLGWLVPAIVALAVSILAKALRWGLLFRPHYHPSWRTLTAGILVGQMVNNALPIRLGEVARIQYLADAIEAPRTFTLGTIALEKALDSVSLLGLFILVIPFALLPEWVRQSGLIVTVAAGVFLIGGIVIVSRRDSIRWIADAFVERAPALGRIAASRRVATILKSLDVLGHAGLLVRALLYSALALAAGAAVNLAVLLAIGRPFDLPAALFVLLLGYLGGTVPASPGRIGVFQAITMLSLAPFGVDPATGFSYSLILYGVVIVLPTLAAVAVLARQPFRLKPRPARN